MRVRLLVLSALCGSLMMWGYLHGQPMLTVVAGAVLAWCYRILWSGVLRDR